MIDLKILRVTALQISVIGLYSSFLFNVPKSNASTFELQAEKKTTFVAQAKKININTATNAELDRLELPGTKPSLSERIEQGRPYKKPDDMVTKKAISQSEFNLIKNLVTVK